jgi:hypothetical protein
MTYLSRTLVRSLHWVVCIRSIGFVRATAFLQYGKDCQLHRRMLQRYFSKDKILGHRDIQTREARLLVHNLAASTSAGREECLIRCVVCDCAARADTDWDL